MRGHVDLEALRNERIDAALDVRCIDILTIAEEATFGLATSNGATTFEFGETFEITTHVDVGRAGPIATRNAMVLTRIRAHHGNVTAIFAVPFAACFRSFDAIVGRRLRCFASLRGGLNALLAAADHAIERRGIAFCKAGRSTITRAHRRSSRRATTFATSDEIERFALAGTATFDLDFATKAIGIKIEIAAFGRRRDGECRRGREQEAGKCEKRKSQFAEVHDRFFLPMGSRQR